MSLAAPGTNPASNLELKLPHTIGSANQLLKVDGNGQLGWADDSTTDSTKLPLAGGTLTGTLTGTQIRYASGGSKWNGNSRSVVIGYSGTDYANLGMGWVPTGTNGVYTSANTDYQSRLELYNGLQIYGSGASVTSGQTITWKTVADFKTSGIKLYYDGGGTEKLGIYSNRVDIPDTLRLSNGWSDIGTQMCLGSDSSGHTYIAGYNLRINTGNNNSRTTSVYVSAGGALAIGTTSPQQGSHPSIHLHSDQNDDARIAITTPNKASGRIGYYGLSNRFGIDMYNGFQIRDVGDSYATRLLIDSSGRILYGTTSSTRETSLVLVGNSNSYTTNPGTLDLFMGNTPSNLGTMGQICFGTQNVVGARIDGRADQDWTVGSARGTHLRFLTCDNGTTTLDERMRISNDGDLLVGTTTGAYRLNVREDLNSGGNLVYFGNSDSTYSQGLTLSFDSNKDIEWSGGSGAGGMDWNMGTRGYKWRVGGSDRALLSQYAYFTLDSGSQSSNSKPGIELKSTGYTGNVTRLFQDSPNANSVLETTERSLVLDIDSGNSVNGTNLSVHIDGTEEFRFDPGSLEFKNSSNASRGTLLGGINYYSNTNLYVDLTQWRLSDNWNVLEVFGYVNPNSSGSGQYTDPLHMYIYRGVGWNGGIKNYIYSVHVAPPARQAFPGGSGMSGNSGVSAVWYHPSSGIVGNKSATSTHYIRLLIPNANNGANFQKNFRVMRRF